MSKTQINMVSILGRIRCCSGGRTLMALQDAARVKELLGKIAEVEAVP
jgi:hypothetical protein